MLVKMGRLFVVLARLIWPDHIADRAVGKMALVVRLGDKARWAFLLTTILTYMTILLLSGKVRPTTVVVASMITLPFACHAVWWFWRRRIPAPAPC